MFIVHIAGHLGKDPETRFTPSGQKVTTFTVATNHRKGKEDITIWVRVTVWGDRLDKIMPYLKKGSAVIVTGRMNPPSSYTDKEGRTQISLEITAEMVEFSPFGKSDRPAEGGQPGANQPNAQASGYVAHDSSNYQYDESQFQNNQPAYGKSSTPYGGQAVEDDTLPF